MNYTLSLQSTRLGEFDCRVVDTPKSQENPTALVILCHGFGAPGDDLVPCAREIIAEEPQKLDGTRFIFPAAPLELQSGLVDSRAWWPIDMEALQIAMMTGNVRDLRNDQPESLPQRRQALLELIELQVAETGLPTNQVVLGGFSQGSMLATDVALHMQEPPGGLVVWSGTLLNEQCWSALANRDAARRFPIVQTHGSIDPLLPMVGAEWLRDLLVGADYSVEFHSFVGQHTIPPQGISLAAKLITTVV